MSHHSDCGAELVVRMVGWPAACLETLSMTDCPHNVKAGLAPLAVQTQQSDACLRDCKCRSTRCAHAVVALGTAHNSCTSCQWLPESQHAVHHGMPVTDSG